MDNWCNYAGGCVENTWYGPLIGAAIVIGVFVLSMLWGELFPPRPPKQEPTWDDLPPKKQRKVLLAQAERLEKDAKHAKSADIAELLRDAAAKQRRRADAIATQPHDSP